MRTLPFRPLAAAPAPIVRPRVYFVHVPKTAGVTLKTYLEDNFPLGASLVIHEAAARALPPAEINRYRLWTGHYASEVLSAIAPAPDVTLLVVRDPVTRLRSWAAHERRSQQHDFPAYGPGMTDVDALQGPGRHHLFQAFWLARALRDGAASTRVPDVAEVPALLDEVTLVGLTEELDRFMQLVAFRMGWPAPPLGWHLNRRPDENGEASNAAVPDEVRRLLAVDMALYEDAARRFWNAYGAMLRTIRPEATWPDDQTPRAIPVDTVQGWLRDWHLAQFAESHRHPLMTAELSTTAPASGEGWWWRQAPEGAAPYRWSGPGTEATLLLPPLEAERDYDLTLELVGAVDWPTWEQIAIAVNGHAVDVVKERFGPVANGRVNLRVHARVPQAVTRATGPNAIGLTVPDTKPVPGTPLVDESTDTRRRDTRPVGVALHRASVMPAAARLAPAGGWLLTSRTPAAAAAAR